VTYAEKKKMHGSLPVTITGTYGWS
jgi:hypothetical protein